MSTLTIKPVEYAGRRLQELGDRVTTAFYPAIENFKIADRLSLRELLFKDAIDPIHADFLTEEDFSRPYRIAFYGFTFGNLLSRFGGLVLGVTDVPLTFMGPKDSYKPLVHRFNYSLEGVEGIGDQKNNHQLAVVSTHRKVFRKEDSDYYIDRLVRLAIHEVGHSFSLEHHKGKNKTPAGNPCPMMEAGDISQADDILCLRCYKKIVG